MSHTCKSHHVKKAQKLLVGRGLCPQSMQLLAHVVSQSQLWQFIAFLPGAIEHLGCPGELSLTPDGGS